MQPPLLLRQAFCVALEHFEDADEARHVRPHTQAVHAAQAERQEHHPEAAEDEQHGDRIRVVEAAEALLALTQAQAHGQADAQFAGFAAKALQPGEQEAERAKQAQADQGMAGRPEAQTGAACTQPGEQQHAQHAEAVQWVGLGRLEGAGRGPEKPRVSAEQAKQQGQGAAKAGDHCRSPGGGAGMPAEGLS